MTNEKEKGKKESEIRNAIEADIGDLVALENVCFDTYYYREHRFTKVEFGYYIHDKDKICLVALVDSSIVAYTAGVIKRSRSRLLANIDSIAVVSRFRRRGYGSRLLRAFFREVKKRSCEQISLVIAVSNEAGIRFFTEHGFKRLQMKPSYYGEGIDGLVMVSNIL